MRNGWSPYFGGVLTGLLLITWVLATTYLLGKTKFLGASTAFVRVASLVENAVNPDAVKTLSYYQKYKPKVDWKLVLVFVGVPLGAFAAAVKNNEFRVRMTHERFRAAFGDKPALRAFMAFIGGFLLVYGARLTGGCPSGHGLSGMSQLSLSSFISIAGFFAGGIPLALILYRKRRG
ncbi:YeeE/YedE thiosulfate transporter family protein [Thermodesulfatator atlanticus]|uniref:YeeE/YedE thiosulfate transporter family protein n=1 Tax=Thermodesulfatator atlanticus TaxID=501497 RepID=UPI0003B61C88|nr:YeeE/YedE thiosulfate transporter family protein [Thermodesulfatator atlanticus]